ncbi:MAG TPA: hypothetical protein VGL86_21205 [Polyangia bacterium]
MPAVTRREFLQLVGAGTAVLIFPPGCGSGGFLDAADRATLTALANAVLPPDDQPGGAALGAVAYIEALLGAFDNKVPFVFLGGPYSGRAPFADSDGNPSSQFPPDGFATPIALDRVGERAWRVRLYGSPGVKGGAPNDALLGPTIGLRDNVKAALAQARAAAGRQPIASLDADALAQLFAGLDDDFKDLLIMLVSEGAFGAPEYGGNPSGAGWAMTHFEGDQMPLGYSVWDANAGMYRERPDAPVTTASAAPDPEPLDDDTRAFLTQLVTLLGGKEFP